MRLGVLLALILCGGVLGSLLIALILFANGAQVSDLMNEDFMSNGSAMMVRLVLMLNHVTMFLLPGIVWALIYYKKKWRTYLDLDFNTRWIYILAGIAFLIVAYPLVAKSNEWNQAVDLPEWMNAMENQSAALLKNILNMNTIGALLLNIIVIGIIPGVGEELIFRGIIQKEMQSYIRNPYIAIVVTAVIFSAIHFQFQGFLARFLLGLVLGLIYYWTGSLWISMAVHAFNNGLQVVATYLYPTMVDQDLEDAVPVKWYILIASLLLTSMLGYWFYNQHALKPSSSDTATIQDQNLFSEHE